MRPSESVDSRGRDVAVQLCVWRVEREGVRGWIRENIGGGVSGCIREDMLIFTFYW